MHGAILTTAARPATQSVQSLHVQTRRPRVSVIVPLYNEQESVRPLYAAIVQSLGDLGCDFEMVFVDDGSSDDTVAIATQIARIDARLRIVKFRRNYGQTPAMAAGIEHARGDILVSRKIPSRIANWLIGKVTGVPIRDNGCSLKAFRAELIKSIPLYSEMHRFIPAMASIAGPRVAEIKVRHHARRYGSSKYGLSRIYKVLLDLMVIKTVASFASRPLRWFALLSTPLLLIGLIALTHAIFHMAATRGHLSLPIAGAGIVFLSSAVILLFSGALAELIYSSGDIRDREFLRLTQRVLARRKVVNTSP
jgi:Glycosyl transferase family 2